MQLARRSQLQSTGHCIHSLHLHTSANANRVRCLLRSLCANHSDRPNQHLNSTQHSCQRRSTVCARAVTAMADAHAALHLHAELAAASTSTGSSLWHLLATCGVMFVGAFGCGMLPLFVVQDAGKLPVVRREKNVCSDACSAQLCCGFTGSRSLPAGHAPYFFRMTCDSCHACRSMQQAQASY